MPEIVYFTEFINDLFWFDEKEKKWCPASDHPDEGGDGYEWKYVGNGQLPEDHTDAAKNNTQCERMIGELEGSIIAAVIERKKKK